MNKQIIISGAVFGMLAVIAGAFGAHGLKPLIGADQLAIWHTAVEYQFYHTLALLFLSKFARFKSNSVFAAYLFFTFGIILFSGSLYLLACRNLFGLPMWIGAITPVGGLLFIAGWITLIIVAIRNK